MIITGAKGAGKSESSEGGKTAENTLRSSAVVNVVEALGEGVIVGLVDGARSIFFDNTPLENVDGSRNFQGVEWEPRYGLPSQAPLAGTDRAATPYTVEAQVKIATGPITRTIIDGDADGVQVVARIPALAYQNKENGDLAGADVQYVFERRAAGGNWEVVVSVNIIQQKCTSPYSKASYINRPPGTDSWDLRMRRINADSTTIELQNDCYWESYSTVINGQYTYDDTALIKLRVDASLFGSSIGARSYHVDGLIINVPSNYDPNTRAYTGVWDGTFLRKWTNNPAWVFYDLVINSRYGLGEFVNASLIDKWSLYQIARYCDQLVPSGFKNAITGDDIMEPRFTFNGVINTREEAYKVLQNITTAFRGMAYWSLGQVFCSADMPSDPVAALVPANVIGGHFKYSGTAMKARHSVALCSWNDPQDFYRSSVEVFQSPTQLRRFGYRAVEVRLIGCTSRGQAHRFGKWIIDTEEYETETVQFTMSWDGYVLKDNQTLKPGDIILILDPRKNGNYRAGGRLAAAAAVDNVTLDFPFEFEAGVAYTISAMMPDGSFETKTIGNYLPDNKTVTLSQPFSDIPLVNVDWIIQAANFQARRYRVMSVQEGADNLFTVTALIHDPGKYARVEGGLALEPIKYVRPRNTVDKPTNITAIESRYFQNGVSHSRVTLSWTTPNDFQVRDYLVTADTPRGFEAFPASTAPSIDITDAVRGNWRFYISARARTGLVSVPVPFDFTVGGWEAVDGPIPDDLKTSEGSTTFSGRAPTIAWTNVFPLNALEYPVENIFRVYDPISGDLLHEESVAQTTYTYSYERNINNGGPRRLLRFDITAKNNVGVESAPASITVLNPVPAAIAPSLKGGVGIIEVTYQPSDNDYAGMILWASLSPAYSPNISDALYDGPDTTVILNLAAGTWYIYAAAYDSFGKEGIVVGPPTTLTINDLQGTLAQVIPALIAAKGDVTTDDMENVGDLIATMLAQMIEDRDDNDMLHKRSHQELAVRTGNLSAIVAEETTARIEADFAEATQRELLQVTINTNVLAAVANEIIARASADEALTSSLALQTSRVDATQATLATESLTRANETGALSAQYSTLSTTVGSNTASISTLVTSVDGVKVQYGVIGTIDGVTGGFIMSGVKALDGSVSFAMQIRGNLIVDGTISGDKVMANTIIGNNIQANTITGSKILADTITADKIKAKSLTAGQLSAGVISAGSGLIGSLAVESLMIGDSAVTVPQFQALSNNVSLPIGPLTVLSFTVSIDTTGLAGKPISLIASTSCSVQALVGGSQQASIIINGATVSENGQNVVLNTVGTVSSTGGYTFTASGGVQNIPVRVDILGTQTSLVGQRILTVLAAKR